MPASMNIDQAKGKNASGPITRRRFVKLDPNATDGESVLQCDTAGENAYGVSLFTVTDAAIARGKGCSVIIDGRCIVEVSEYINVGDPVGVDANGMARVADSGDYIVGMCDEPSPSSWTAGDECAIDFRASGSKAA